MPAAWRLRLLQLTFSCLFLSFVSCFWGKLRRLRLLVAVTQLLFNAEKLSRWLEYHAVNDLLRQMHFVEPDPAIITGFGLLQGNVKPVLLFDGITAAFIIAGLIRLVV